MATSANGCGTSRDDLGLNGAVRFHGFRPQAECAEILQRADALILNSLYECGGAVVLEAMSMGLPVIGPDWGGPADYLDETCGILVHPCPRETYAARIAEAIGELAADPERRVQMGRRRRGQDPPALRLGRQGRPDGRHLPHGAGPTGRPRRIGPHVHVAIQGAECPLPDPSTHYPLGAGHVDGETDPRRRRGPSTDHPRNLPPHVCCYRAT